jgi:hypothetical protein
MALKVFWHRCGVRSGNFGDNLTPLLLDYLGVDYEWSLAAEADFVGIGSVCQQIPKWFQGVIWSTGNLYANRRNDWPHARVFALRGEFTRQRTQARGLENIPLGDGGLLCSHLAPQERKRCKLGIIPHYVHAQNAAIAEVASRTRDICVIDICDEPRLVLSRVAQCEAIVSTSLHGLIVADSLGIPNCRITVEDEQQPLGGDFKFRDYYSAFGIDAPAPIHLRGGDDLDALLSQIGPQSRPGLKNIQEQLLDQLRAGLDGQHLTGWAPQIAPRTERKTAAIPRINEGRPGGEGVLPDENSRKRVFVVGTGRSGTCWMGDLLGLHPQVRSFVELRPLFDLVTRAAVYGPPDAQVLRQIFEAYERLFLAAAPHHCADKSHPALWIAEELAERFDNSWFVGMVRDVHPTVASMLRHNGVRRWCEQWDQYPIPNRFLGITHDNLAWYREASLVQRCVARWWSHRAELVRLENSLGGRVMLVPYERLVRETSDVLAELGSFLGLQDPFPPITPLCESLEKWRTQLNSEELDQIDDALAYLTAGIAPTKQLIS